MLMCYGKWFILETVFSYTSQYIKTFTWWVDLPTEW